MLRRNALFVCLLIAALAATGQTLGDLSGEVRDPSGAVVPGVRMTLTNVATNASRQVETNEAGLYSFPAVQPGVYTLRAERQGFRAFVRQRPLHEAKLRVFNPELERDGWTSSHSAVAIVNDDMPFLVDSITMEINRQGLSVHLIVHPVLVVQRDAGGRVTIISSDKDLMQLVEDGKVDIAINLLARVAKYP